MYYSQIKIIENSQNTPEKFWQRLDKKASIYTGLVTSFQTLKISQTQPHLEPTIADGISVLKFEWKFYVLQMIIMEKF